MLSLNPQRPAFRFPLAASPNPLPHRAQQGLARDYHLRALHLVVRLSVIAHVRQENADALCDQQQARAAGEAAKISDVRKMAHQKRIESCRGEVLPEFLLAPEEVHSAEFSRRRST